jgi:hypothetical protein
MFFHGVGILIVAFHHTINKGSNSDQTRIAFITLSRLLTTISVGGLIMPSKLDRVDFFLKATLLGIYTLLLLFLIFKLVFIIQLGFFSSIDFDQDSSQLF